MAIEIRPSGEAKSQALAGEIIGKGKARQQFGADVREANARTFQAEQQQKAMDWEAQKIQMRDAQEFAQELRLWQARLNAEARSQEWEVEKMEMVSQADFAQEERVRTEKYGQFSDTMTYIDGLDQKGVYSKEQIADMRFRAALPYERDGFKEVSEVLGEHDAAMRLQEEQQRQQQRQEGIEDKQKYGLKPAGYEYLTEEERQQSARIQGGLEPRATTEKEKSEYGVLPGEFGLLSPEQQQQAAMIRTGLNLKLNDKDLEFARIKKIDEVTKILDDFEENADINPGWGTTIVPLAVKDSKGVLTEASPAATELYRSAKLFHSQLITPIEIPDWLGGDTDDQGKYKTLIQRGVSPEEIKSRFLGR